MGLPAESHKDILDKVQIVRRGNRLFALSGDENIAADECPISLEEAEADLTDFEVRKVRERINSLLTRQNMLPSSRISQFLERTQPCKSAPLSPLLAVRSEKFDSANDNHDLLALPHRLEGIHWLALLDFDNTLYKSDSEHTIMLHQFARFMKEKHPEVFERNTKAVKALDQLIKDCDDWREQNTMIEQGFAIKDILTELNRKELIEYEDAIEDSGKLSAAAFQGLKLKKLEEYGREFVETAMGGRLFDYVAPVIKKLKDHGILPVITTGLPDFLVPAILEKTGITHGNGMTYKTDTEGKLTGFVDVNLGMAENKGMHGQKLTEKGYAIVLSMGDSEGDMGLHRCSVGRGKPKHDVHGTAVIVNASQETIEELERTYKIDINSGFVRIVKPSENYDDDVVAAVGVRLRKLFYPLHKYQEMKKDADPEKLNKFLIELDIALKEAEMEDQETSEDDEERDEDDNKQEDDKFQNLETIKRIRDILRKREKLSEFETTELLLRFYPKILMEYVMKPHNLDTRDPSAVASYVESNEHLLDTRDERAMEALLRDRLKISEESRREVLESLIAYNRKHGISKPPPKTSSFPPPAELIEFDQEDTKGNQK